MSKMLSMAAIGAVLSAPAFAANMENPLYIPTAGELYSKTNVSMMAKQTDDTTAQITAQHNGEKEFPIWRGSEELGYGITDRLSVVGQVGYTYNGDIDRKGLHLGRLGLNYRVFDGTATSFVWDMYADAHLGGISKMTGEYGATGFKYDNYSTGQYGAWLGTRVGKQWGALTGALYAEAAYYFADGNTEIDINVPSMIAGPTYGPMLVGAGVNKLNGTAVADMKSFTDWNIGTKWAYEIDSTWTAGFGIAWKHHDNHMIDAAEIDLTTEVPAPLKPVIAGVEKSMTEQFKGRDLFDAFEEFPITVSIANQLTEAVQVALWTEYTIDHGDNGSQNSTDTKWEIGARLNARF